MNSRRIAVPPPFTSVGDVVAGLAELEVALIARQDRRAVFATAYLQTTQTVSGWLEQRLFLRNDKVAELAVEFANAYLRALAGYEQHRFDAIPAAWRLAFDACSSDRVSVVQLLLLGVNAHINHDLPHAVVQSAIDVNCRECHSDYTRINDALRAATPLVRQRIAALYRRRFRLAGFFFGRAIDDAVSVTLERARHNSWMLAKALDAARPASERMRVGAFIDRRAASAGRLILRRRYAPAASLASLYAVKPSFS